MIHSHLARGIALAVLLLLLAAAVAAAFSSGLFG